VTPVGVVWQSGTRLSMNSCRARCCEDPACIVWQYREDKGCYFTSSDYHCSEVRIGIALRSIHVSQ
jgi:hypothetical protein